MRTFPLFALTAIAGACLTAPAMAQSQQPTIHQIRYYHIKSDHMADFQSAVKDFNAVLKKANAQHVYTSWSPLSGDTREFVRSDFYSKWDELNQSPYSSVPQPELQHASDRISNCVDDTRTVITVIDPAASLPLPDTPSPMIYIDWNQVQAGKGPEFHRILREDALPGMKKAGVKTYLVGQTAFGGPTQRFEIVIGIHDWSDFSAENPLVRGMGRDAATQFFNKRAALLVQREQQVYRYRPELSYLPASQQGAQR